MTPVKLDHRGAFLSHDLHNHHKNHHKHNPYHWHRKTHDSTSPIEDEEDSSSGKHNAPTPGGANDSFGQNIDGSHHLSTRPVEDRDVWRRRLSTSPKQKNNDTSSTDNTDSTYNTASTDDTDTNHDTGNYQRKSNIEDKNSYETDNKSHETVLYSINLEGEDHVVSKRA